MDFTKSNSLRARAHSLIPGGAHTYSKGDDQFPQLSPGFIERGEGAYCWDVDGNKFLDWGMGLRSVILGHVYPRVVDAVSEQLRKGSNFTRPTTLEADFAELLTGIIPCAKMVKFCKNGSDATSAAVRLARAYTGRDYVVRCRDHAFFSFYDWFIGSTAVRSGIPRAVQDLTLQFDYDNADSLRALIAQFPGQIACVILEPATFVEPSEGFLEDLRAITREHGIVLIFDEMVTGFRWHLNGAQTFYGVTPDLCTLGKSIGNGFSVSAVMGRREIMELGGLHHSREKVFLLSCTHGGEAHGLAAGMATVMELRDKSVSAHLWATGRALMDGFNALANRHNLQDHLEMIGYPCSPIYVCRDHTGEVSMAFRTLFLQEIIRHGVLMPWVAISYSHGPREVEITLDAVDKAMGIYALALEHESVNPFLVGEHVKPVFRTFN